jgi:hypothetical protein
MSTKAVTDKRKRKRCPLPNGCGKMRLLTKFCVHRHRKDGRGTYCNDCTARMSKQNRIRLKELINQHCRARQERRLRAQQPNVSGRRRMQATPYYG